jgi:hypothetical protein
MSWYYLPLGPFIEDGPFHGVAVEPITDRAPSPSVIDFDRVAQLVNCEMEEPV